MCFAFFKFKLINEHVWGWMSGNAVGNSPAEAGTEWTWRTLSQGIVRWKWDLGKDALETSFYCIGLHHGSKRSGGCLAGERLRSAESHGFPSHFLSLCAFISTFAQVGCCSCWHVQKIRRSERMLTLLLLLGNARFCNTPEWAICILTHGNHLWWIPRIERLCVQYLKNKMSEQAMHQYPSVFWPVEGFILKSLLIMKEAFQFGSHC